MDTALMEKIDRTGVGQQFPGFAIAPGTVTDADDGSGEGRVKVKIANYDLEPWARIAAVGGGKFRGFCWTPQQGDEVLVAFSQNDVSVAYVIGGLWSTVDRPPLLLPTDFRAKRVIKTGIAGAPGHEVEFDDVLQSIKITSSTKQT